MKRIAAIGLELANGPIPDQIGQTVIGSDRDSSPLQLHINSSRHLLIGTDLGGVQVGQAYQDQIGSWNVEFEGEGRGNARPRNGAAPRADKYC